MLDHPEYASEWSGLATLSNEIGGLDNVRCKNFSSKNITESHLALNYFQK
jgi:hypothetical protein